jgi:hypothetical protein
MKRMFTLLLGFSVILISSSCHRYYTNDGFADKTRHHKLVAIIPAEMVFTGSQPKNLKPEDIVRLEEADSKAFQQSLYGYILRHANTRKFRSTASLQDVSNTMALLKQNNISIRDSWRQDDANLCRLLGVDAVVRLRIQKNRYMSDAASMGIDVGTQILGAVLNTPVGAPNRTNDILATCSVSANGETLWSDQYQRAADWRYNANQVIDDISNNFGRHFPYREKK